MMVAVGVTIRLNRFLTDHRSGCASSFATTPNRTPGTTLSLSLPAICLTLCETGGSVSMTAPLWSLPSGLRARASGPAKAPPRGRGSGLYSGRFAQGWQLWTTQLKADPTAGIDLGTARHGDRRLLPPFGWALQVSGHPDPRGVISRLRQSPQWRCQQSQAQYGRSTMFLKLTPRMATLLP